MPAEPGAQHVLGIALTAASALAYSTAGFFIRRRWLAYSSGALRYSFMLNIAIALMAPPVMM
jgi:hypothetical protein